MRSCIGNPEATSINLKTFKNVQIVIIWSLEKADAGSDFENRQLMDSYLRKIGERSIKQQPGSDLRGLRGIVSVACVISYLHDGKDIRKNKHILHWDQV